jgi:hypothetical protein
VNSGFYCDVFRRLRENLQRRRPELWREQTWLLHHDNAPSYTSVLNQQFLAKMKLKLKGRRFDTIEEIHAESQRVFDTVTEKNFQEAFLKWRRQWDR